MIYVKYSKGPIKLSVIVASLLATNCTSSMNIYDGLFDNKEATKQTEAEKKLEAQPLPLVDARDYNLSENINKDDPRFILSEAARIAFDEGRFQEALNFWEQIINQYPDYHVAYIGYSQVGRKMNLHRNVLAKLYQYKNMNPQDVFIVTEIAKVHYEIQDYRQALEEIDNVINMQNSDWKLYSLRGVINDKLHYYKEAIASYNKALELSPDNPTVLNNIAVSMMMNGKYEDAEMYASKAIENKNVNIQAFKTYAKILAFKGETEKAQEVLTHKLNNKEKAAQIVNFAKSELSKPSLWGRR